MCGRFTLRSHPHEFAQCFDFAELPPHVAAGLATPRLNISPTDQVLAVRAADVGRELVSFRWGLIPSWAKDPKIGVTLINCRSETAATKPAFRAAFKRRRCLVPADGFYEWKTVGKLKQPYHIRRKDGGLTAIAGLWEIWDDARGFPVETCTLLTTTANDVVRPLHERMPVFLQPESFDLWLDPLVQSPEQLEPLLAPAANELLECVEVDREVNENLLRRRKDAQPGEGYGDPTCPPALLR